MTKILDEANDEGLKTPLTTAAINVAVRNVAPKVSVKLSGKLDLVNRSNSTLQGTVTVANVNSTISKISLINDPTNPKDDFADKFYCVRKGNTFTIYARSNATLTTARVTGYVKVTMSDGNELQTKITFAPTQSVPKVTTPAVQKIYKSASTQVAEFNFNEKLTDGVRISKITETNVPSGLVVQDTNGHLLVTLKDKTLKAGKYNIQVNVYFKGAQSITGSEYGKPVTQTIYVEVKE